MRKDQIARLEVTMDDVEPPVVRRIDVPCAISLADLHLLLQVALGWTNSHLYEFAIGRTSRWGIPDPDWSDMREDASKVQPADVLANAGRNDLSYLYDFGDGWNHLIRHETFIDAEPGTVYPRLVEARGRCPPEDVGGPFGYADFLDIVADPKHPRHAELIEWAGGAFDAACVDVAEIERGLASLATHLTKKAKPRKRASRSKPK